MGRDLSYPVTTAFLASLGFFFLLSFTESRKKLRFCPACRSVFKRHSLLSRLVLPFYWLQVALLILTVGVAVALTLASGLSG